MAGILGFTCVGIRYLYRLFYDRNDGQHFTCWGRLVSSDLLRLAIEDVGKRMQLHTQIDSTVEGVDEFIRGRDVGMTQGRLAPMGKVRVGTVVEAESRSGYIEENREVVVLKVYKNKIVVVR